jgi:hypothetical protein
MSMQRKDDIDSRVEIAASLYVWGLPLVIMHRTRALHCSRGGPGVLRHRSKLASARDRTVVAPNNDTLYSTGWYDLHSGDLQLHVPPMDHPGRYWSVMLLDAFTYVTYVSRRQYGVHGASVRITYNPDAEHDHTRRADTIGMGTPTVWVLVRTLVSGSDDLDAARALQENITVIAPPGHPSSPTALPSGQPNDVSAAGEAFFEELRKVLAIDPPAAWHPQLTGEQLTLLEGSTDSYILAAGVALGHERIKATGMGADRFKNGWGTHSIGTQFGDNVLARARCAQFVLAGHHRVENVYYTALNDNLGEPLDGKRRLMLRFPPGEEPPAGAFWSLTVYMPDMFFYDNSLERYSLGDRTPGLSRNTDGLAITIGAEPPPDITNWLPAPEGPYILGLRIYEGRSDVVDATWFPPPLIRI